MKHSYISSIFTYSMRCFQKITGISEFRCYIAPIASILFNCISIIVFKYIQINRHIRSLFAPLSAAVKVSHLLVRTTIWYLLKKCFKEFVLNFVRGCGVAYSRKVERQKTREITFSKKSFLLEFFTADVIYVLKITSSK